MSQFSKMTVISHLNRQGKIYRPTLMNPLPPPTIIQLLIYKPLSSLSLYTYVYTHSITALI